MKKLLFASMLASIGVLSSCDLDTKGNSAESTQWYAILCDSIKYTNNADAQFTEYIQDALKKDTLCNITYSESAKINIGIMDAAISQCHTQALDTYKRYTRKGITLDKVKRYIYSENFSKDTIIGKYDHYNDIPLKPFKVYISLKCIGQGSLASLVPKDSIIVR